MNFFKKHNIPFFILVAALITGLTVFDDFGIAWDEEAKMRDIGKATVEFVMEGDAQAYLNNPEKYHGPAFEMLLYGLQEIFQQTEAPEAYHFRHLITFLFYWITGVLFFVFIRKEFGNPFVQSVALLWFFLIPRFFPDAFYNSKDLAFFCINMISLLTFRNFIARPSGTTVFLHALVCGFAIGIRILGIVLPVITVGVYLMKRLYDSQFSLKRVYKSAAKYMAWFTVLTIAFTILFWPILWLDPVHHLINAFIEMRHYRWGALVRYNGDWVLSTNLPWHYIPVWIMVTTPELYLVFCGIGLIAFAAVCKQLKWQTLSAHTNSIYSVLIIFASISSVIVLHSVVYDGWRHLYYIYAFMLFLSVSGMASGIRWTARLNRFWNMGLKVAILSATLFIGYEMIQMHPYQHVYFNRTSNISNEEHRFDFELDYWGLSYREAVEKVLKRDTSSQIRLNFSNLAGEIGLNILPLNERKRIVVSDSLTCDYYITNYRWFDKEITGLQQVDSIKVNGLVVSGTFRGSGFKADSQ